METLVLAGLWGILAVQLFGAGVKLRERRYTYASLLALCAAVIAGAISLINGWV